MEKMKKKKTYMEPMSEIVVVKSETIVAPTSWNPDQGNSPDIRIIEGDPAGDGKGAKEFKSYDAWDDGWTGTTSNDNAWN